MKRILSLVFLISAFAWSVKAQDFTQYVSFDKFDTYAKSLNNQGFVYLFAEQSGDAAKGTLSYSAMLKNGKGSLDLKLMKIDEFARGPEKLADINTGIYTKYDHRLVFWSLTKAKQGFLYIELAGIKATLIIAMQPENTQEILEQTMLKIACLDYFSKKD